jgi:O-antigen/teichoic acid export membrane protein
MTTKSLLGRISQLRHVIANAGTLGMGAAIAQAITMLASPVLSRVYGPGQIGVFGAYLGVIALFTASPCLGFEQAFLLERDERGLEGAVGLCVLANAAWLATFAVVLALFHAPIERVLHRDAMELLIAFGPIGIAVAGFFAINQFLSLRVQAVRALARYQILRSVLSSALQVASFRFLAVGLASGQLAGQAIGVIDLSRRNVAVLMASIRRIGDIPALKRLAQTYRTFPLYGAPQSLLSALTAGMPTVLLSAFYGQVEAGYFWLAYRVFGLPNQIVNESLRGAFYHSLAAAHREGRNLRPELVSGSILCCAACALFALPVLVAGPSLFALVFGETWRTAGVFARIAAGAWLIQAASIPSTVAITVLQRQRFYLTLEVVAAPIRLGAFPLAAHWHSAELGVLLYSVASAVHALVVITYALSLTLRTPQPDAGAQTAI